MSSAASSSTYSSSRVALGERIRRKNRGQLKLQIKVLKNQLKEAEKKAEKYKKRIHRIKKKSANKESPQRNVNKLLRGQNVTPTVKKKLLFSDVMCTQIKENFKKQKTAVEKRHFVASISGHVTKKYHYTSCLGKLSSSRLFRRRKVKENQKQEIQASIKKAVVNFLNKDENSRLCAAKKETITSKIIKKQRRYLNDSLQNIYKKFITSHPYRISYSSFCKLRPFYILKPDARIRNTCLCIIHTNISLIVTKLRKLNIIKENTPQDILKSLCCPNEYLKEICLERNCSDCKNKEISWLNFDEDKKTEYQRWVTKRVNVVMGSKEKICQKTIKETVQCTQKAGCRNLKTWYNIEILSVCVTYI